MSNKSQVLALSDAMGNLIDSVEYFDSEPWPDADGTGSYLELIAVTLDNNLAESWIASDTALSSPSFEQELGLTIYPNPVNDILDIHSESMLKNVEVYDLYGKLLQSGAGGQVDFRQFATGIYIVKVTNEKGSFSKKIIKQ